MESMEAEVLLYLDSNGKKVLAYECEHCYALLPYNKCPHLCPVEPEDEVVEEDLHLWIEKPEQLKGPIRRFTNLLRHLAPSG